MILRDFLCLVRLVSPCISVNVCIDKDPSGLLICSFPSQVLHFLNDLALNAKVLEVFSVIDDSISVLIEPYTGEL